MRCSTSNVMAIIVSQLPICEMSWPVKNRRKLRNPIDRNVSRPASRMRRLMAWPPRSVLALQPAPSLRAGRVEDGTTGSLAELVRKAN